MNSYRTRAIVLRRTNYAEADRIIQLLTPNHGKVSVMARGVRREKSKLAGGIELFALTDVTLSNGKGDLGILTGARVITFYRNILAEYDRLYFGYEAIKQISRAIEILDEPTFFELLAESFVYLDDQSIDLRLVRGWFWLQLAILLGTGLNLSTDNAGHTLQESLSYEFDIQDGVFFAKDKGRFTSHHIRLLRLLSARSPRVATQVRDVSKYLDECVWVAERSVPH